MKPNVVVRHRLKGKSHYYNIPFRQCKLSDYKKRNYQVEKNLEDAYLNKICPDFDNYSDILMIKNSYSNLDERISFSVEINRCEQNCKSAN